MSKDYGIPPQANNRLTGQPTQTNLTNATNFRFMLPKVPNSVYFCQSVSFPNFSCPHIAIRTGRGAALKVPGTEVSHGDLSMTYIVNEDMSNYREMQGWFTKMSAFTDGFNGLLSTRDWMSEQGQLMILTNRKTPVVRITFSGLFPTNLSAIEFDNTDTEGKVTVATATLGFTYYTMEAI